MTLNWIYSASIVLLALCTQGAVACSDDDDGSACWYTLWYIWFVLGLFLVVTGVIIVLYIQHRSKERNRSRRRRRSTRTMPIHIIPTGPPGYAEPSHKPPSYEDAIRQPPHLVQPLTQVPGGVVTFAEEYGYRPPPTSLRMVPNTPPQPLPPSYSATIEGQGQGHPTWRQALSHIRLITTWLFQQVPLTSIWYHVILKIVWCLKCCDAFKRKACVQNTSGTFTCI